MTKFALEILDVLITNEARAIATRDMRSLIRTMLSRQETTACLSAIWLSIQALMSMKSVHRKENNDNRAVR